MKRFIKTLLLIFWMGVIFWMSAQPAADSSVTSNGVGLLIYEILAKIFPKFALSSDLFLVRYMPLIRKLAHFTEFGILGILSSVLYVDIFKKHNSFQIILFGFIYACSDEFHQLFVPNRYCTFKDVLIDGFGVLTATLLCHLLYTKWIKRKH